MKIWGWLISVRALFLRCSPERLSRCLVLLAATSAAGCDEEIPPVPAARILADLKRLLVDRGISQRDEVYATLELDDPRMTRQTADDLVSSMDDARYKVEANGTVSMWDSDFGVAVKRKVAVAGIVDCSGPLPVLDDVQPVKSRP